MAEIDTWMPWHIAEYLADTMHLSTLEHGAYLLILGHGWRNDGTIVASDAHLAGVTRLPRDQWKLVKPTIERFFDAFEHPMLGACWRQKRQVLELIKAKGQKAKAHEKAKKAADARWGPCLEHSSSNAQGMPSDGKGSDSSDLPPEDNSALGRKVPVRSEEAVALAAQNRINPPPSMTQDHANRAKTAMDAYPIRSRKDGRAIKKDLTSLNLLAAKVAQAPDFAWEEAAALENQNETPQDFSKWVSSQPDPVNLDNRRKQATTPIPPKPGERPAKKLQDLNA